MEEDAHILDSAKSNGKTDPNAPATAAQFSRDPIGHKAGFWCRDRVLDGVCDPDPADR